MNGLKKLEKSWTTLLNMAVVCSVLTVIVFIQTLSIKRPVFKVLHKESIVIPELQVAYAENDSDYERTLLQVVQSSRKVSFFEARELAKDIVKISLLHKVDPLFVAALIREESRFKDNAASNRGAIGLMQLKPSTASYVATKNGLNFEDEHLLDSQANIYLGISYLKYLSKKFNGNLNMVLAAYNWGPHNVKSIKGDFNRLPAVTKKYVSTISNNYKKWKQVHRNIVIS